MDGFHIETASRERSGSLLSTTVVHDDVSIRVIASTGGQGFGLLGALVDASVTMSRGRRAEELIPPLPKLRAAVTASAGPAGATLQVTTHG